MTPTELEARQSVQAMNRAWTTSHVEELRNYFDENIVAITPTDRHRLEGREACIAAWAAFVEQAKVIISARPNHQPFAIRAALRRLPSTR